MKSTIIMHKPTDNSHSKFLGREHYYIKLYHVFEGYRWTRPQDTLTPDPGCIGWGFHPRKAYKSIPQAISAATKAGWRITLD